MPLGMPAVCLYSSMLLISWRALCREVSDPLHHVSHFERLRKKIILYASAQTNQSSHLYTDLTTPASRAICTCSALALAVVAMIVKGPVRCPSRSSRLISRVQVRPSITGISQSISTMDNLWPLPLFSRQ